jgi:hypothetical protein
MEEDYALCGRLSSIAWFGQGAAILPKRLQGHVSPSLGHRDHIRPQGGYLALSRLSFHVDGLGEAVLGVSHRFASIVQSCTT